MPPIHSSAIGQAEPSPAVGPTPHPLHRPPASTLPTISPPRIRPLTYSFVAGLSTLVARLARPAHLFPLVPFVPPSLLPTFGAFILAFSTPSLCCRIRSNRPRSHPALCPPTPAHSFQPSRHRCLSHHYPLSPRGHGSPPSPDPVARGTAFLSSEMHPSYRPLDSFPPFSLMREAKAPPSQLLSRPCHAWHTPDEHRARRDDPTS